MFGDADGAVLVEAGSNKVDFLFEMDGAGVKYLHPPLMHDLFSDRSVTVGYLHMDGGEVMKFALSRVPNVVNQALLNFKWAIIPKLLSKNLTYP